MIAFIGIGANLGDARANVEDALARLARVPHSRLLKRSSLYRTAPIDSSGDDYINALRGIEQAHGRERPYRNAPRTLDLDLLLFGAEIIATPELTVPHPRMHQRAFVLAPLLEIAPAALIPGLGPAASFAPLVADQAIERLPC